MDWDNLSAALVNAANGLVKLDGGAKVPIAQMSAVIDADTVDTKHYADIIVDAAADADAAIAVHAALASVHHTKTVSADIDHGSIGGLADDDHPKYIKRAGDTMDGLLTLSGAPTSDLHASSKLAFSLSFILFLIICQFLFNFYSIIKKIVFKDSSVL